MEPMESGTIATFYSYKGGTGRSMALANVACLLGPELATKDQKLLIIDWDLEAPGLHRYFPKSEDAQNGNRVGLIDYFMRIFEWLDERRVKQLSSPDGFRYLEEFLPLDEFIVPSVSAGVDMIRAGEFGPDYAHRIASFPWADLYRRCPGAYRAFRELLVRRYRWCLIDSRTGLSDVSGVCTMLMPEKLVTVFTPNRQSVDGAIDVALAAVEYRRKSDDGRPLSVFPLPSRIVTEEHKLLRAATQKYQRRFEDCLRTAYELERCDLNAYFQEVAIPHKGFYGFHELVAVRDDASADDALSINRAYQRFSRRLLELDSPWDNLDEQAQDSQQSHRGEQLPSPQAQARSAFLPAFSYELFLSYSRIDDEPLNGDGFVTRLHSDLEARITALLGVRVRIFRDLASAPMAFGLEQSVRDAIDRSALFLAIVSPGYVNSNWALGELSAFASRRGQGSVFWASTAPVPRNELPQLISDTLGYAFFELTPNGRASDPRPGTIKYHEVLNDLAHDIKNRLLSLRSGTSYPAKGPTTVFLAETTSDTAEFREKLRRELVTQGYRVVPEQVLPVVSSELERAITSELAEASLSVHILGSTSGFVPEGETRSVVALQYDLAHQREGLVRLVWASVGRELSSDLRKRFEGTEPGGDDLVRSDFVTFKSMVVHLLTEREDAPAVRSLVYVVCSSEDKPLAKELGSTLQSDGFETIFPLVEGTAAERRRDHEESIKASDYVLVIWDTASESWIRSVVRDLMKRRAAGGARPSANAVLFTGGPSSASKLEFDFPLGPVVRTAADLGPVLKSLRGRAS